jgi:hypothetical protein
VIAAVHSGDISGVTEAFVTNLMKNQRRNSNACRYDGIVHKIMAAIHVISPSAAETLRCQFDDWLPCKTQRREYINKLSTSFEYSAQNIKYAVVRMLQRLKAAGCEGERILIELAEDETGVLKRVMVVYDHKVRTFRLLGGFLRIRA